MFRSCNTGHSNCCTVERVGYRAVECGVG
jgi:hypothetical protein